MRTLNLLQGGLAGPPSVCSPAPGHLDVFAVGPDKQVWSWWLEGENWQGPVPLPMAASNGTVQIPSAGLCAVSSAPGVVDVFAAGTGNTPWWWRRNGTVWAAPKPLPTAYNTGIQPVPVAAVCSGANSIDVFAPGPFNTPWWWRFDGNIWNSYGYLPTTGSGIPLARIAAVSPRPGRFDVFSAGSGNQLWHWWWAGQWLFEQLGGTLPSEGVSAVSWGPDRIDVFAASGAPGNPLLHWWSDGGQFSGPENLGGNLAPGTVSAVSRAPNRLDVFGVSKDGRIARWQWDGRYWSGPNYRGDNVRAGDVSAVVRPGNRVDVFVLGQGNSLLQWPGGGLENATKKSWTNWPENLPRIDKWHCRPGSLQELVAIVKEAEQQGGRRVRAVGSAWSSSDVAVTPDVLVETDLLASVVTEVLSASPSILIPSASNLNLVHVEAGIKLVDLNRLLDGRDLAMKTLGGSSGQSLAGALSTSVHGADFDRGPLPDTIRAIHLVGPGGIQHWIEPTAAISDRDRLSTALGLEKANIHYDDDWFNSVLVSMGAMGIIYSLIVEVLPQYKLRATCEHLTWDTARARLQAGTPFAPPTPGTPGNRAVQVVVSQFKHDDGTRPSFLTTRSEVAKSTPNVDAGGPPAGLTGMLGSALIPILNEFPGRYPDAVKFALFDALPAKPVVGWAHTVTTAPPPPSNFPRGSGLEFAFDANSNDYLDYVDAALQILDTAYEQEKLGLGGWLSLRFVGQSRAYLSPQHHSTRTCMVEFTAATGLNSTKPLMTRLEAEGKARGGIQHWGMFNDLNASDVAKAYPRLDTWRKIRRELTNGGTLRTFDNDFTDRCGLSSWWSGWVALGAPPGGFVGAPSVISRHGAVCNIYVRGNDNALWQRAWVNGAWQGWSRHDDGGVLASEPALGSMGPDHEQVFIRGTDNQVWQKYWTGGGGWSVWEQLGAPPGGFVGAPSVISRNGSVCNIYVRGNDNALWQRAWVNNNWLDWSRHNDGGVLASEPALDSMGTDHEQVFIRGTDNQVWQKWWTGGGGWSGWEALGAPPVGFVGAPSVISRHGAVCNMYVRGNDNALWQRAWVNGAWEVWSRHNDGGVLASEPALGSLGPDHEQVFVRGTDNQVWQKWWTR